MKKTIAFVTALVAAVFILLTVVVTAVLYHGVYEDNVKVTLSEELDILSYLYETGEDITAIGGRNGRLTIIAPDGRKIGLGRSAYSNTEATALVGKHDVKPIVHYDYLIVNELTS